jgi:hypothetical protein
MAMAGQIFVGNSDNIIGGPARILFEAASYPLPAKLSQIVNLTTYLPVNDGTYGWVDVGQTSAGTRVQTQVAQQQWRTEQFGQIRTVPGDWSGQLSTQFAEMTQQNKVNLMAMQAVADSDVREARTNLAALIKIPKMRAAVFYPDDRGLLHAIVLPLVMWDGAAIQQQLARGQMLDAPVTFAIYPDTKIIDPVTGLPILRVDFDQY